MATRPRRTIICLNCGEARPHLAHGLCARCYRREDRAQDSPIDPHSPPALSRDQLRRIKGFSDIMTGCTKVRVNTKDLVTIRRILDPYLASVQHVLDSRARPHTSEPVSEPSSVQPITNDSAQNDVSVADSELSPTDSWSDDPTE